MSWLARQVDTLVSREDRPLKTSALDVVEFVLLLLSGLLLLGFTVTVLLDVVTRLIGSPILWLQEATLICFVWATFVGAAAAQRRGDHFVVTSLHPSASPIRRRITETFNGLVLLAVGLVVAYFGYRNFQHGFGNQLTVTGLPLATLTGAIPVFGVLLTVFTAERLVLGWRKGFPPPHHVPSLEEISELEGGHV
jgi:TRAP-type C4-dicarboxylate transport system permease small subunit